MPRPRTRSSITKPPDNGRSRTSRTARRGRKPTAMSEVAGLRALRSQLMSGETPDWPREKRQLPSGLTAVAAANPGGSVAEIDGSIVRDPDGYVPAEAIIGCYLVGQDGRATGGYARNPQHGPVRDDFTKLESPDHWLGWLPDTPGRSVRTALEETLAEQVAGTVVEWVKIVEEPVFLTTGIRSSSDPDRLTVRRAAIAVVFALGVRAPGREREILTGAFSWAAVGLDRPRERRDRTWLDLGMSRARAEEFLQRRVHQV